MKIAQSTLVNWHACWIIENESGTERIIGLLDVPGSSDGHDVYRSELAGL